ncbi:hypothetical protein A3B45_02360 [Candidatus Daviesbacteria bacterium RIFCSPLOWO2_01_FULL_39_12]|uniref:Uncharacterized protein n=1 Tax=Candidatus Daviesbacteria bacterium RIFCSPLOWO2_01_FULL_39_12 TaxID=1797785 RepID=A0A1F5KSQ3_9BACT|nr:MAG: hypothetical protein A3D79_00770 [Candidatus Daviesbacteria bacterium RIFCSPHIGHO2_02_FULL_39_8]OGE43850.1 MAG: hypothetical protein A3B45_02360 [Candidatus Daviesbacteria bacterium RIFCSPLOWO2_01_FULL_39_12]
MNTGKEALTVISVGAFAALSFGCQQVPVSKEIKSTPTSESTPQTQQLSQEQMPTSLLERFLAANLRYGDIDLLLGSIIFIDEKNQAFELARPSSLPGAIVLRQTNRAVCAPATFQAKKALNQLGGNFRRGDVVDRRLRLLEQATQNAGSCIPYMVRKHQNR